MIPSSKQHQCRGLQNRHLGTPLAMRYPTHNALAKAVAELFSLLGNKRKKKKESKQKNTSLILMEQRSRLNITSLFCCRLTNNGPTTLSNPLHTGNLIGNRKMAFVCLNQRKRRERSGGGGGQLGGKGNNHQVHSMPICRLVNGLILLECKAAATLTQSLSRQWRENPVTGSPQGRGIKAGTEERAPSLCTLVSPKTNASSFLMEALWRWSTLRNRW